MANTPLRRLADLPGVDALELKALMKPRFADPDEPEGLDEIDPVAKAVFGLSLEEAQGLPMPADWDGIERLSGSDIVEAFEAEGWDVGDKRRKPLRILGLFALPLALAMRGIAGELPFHAKHDHEKTDWGSSLAADAKRFTKR